MAGKSKVKVQPQRVTTQSKWIIGGDGTWRDLMVVSPLTKLSIDFLAKLFHPREYYLLKKVILTLVIAVTTMLSTLSYTVTVITVLATLFALTAFTKLYRYLKLNANHYVYTHRYHANEPFVPLDESGDTRSALLLTRHVLIGGDSGSGKSNAVWMILDSLVRYDIPFRTTVIDPAGGVELSDLQDASYTINYVDRPADVDQCIIRFRDEMNNRLARLKKHGIRLFDPRTPIPGDDNNWHYLLIDELLLCAAQIKQGPLSPLGDVLSVGRKAGYIVIACTQLSQKTTLGDFRDLFPQRIAFAVRTHDMVDALLGTGAHQDAPAHLLRHVGEGFLYSNKQRGFYHFRTRHITDTRPIAQAPIRLIKP